MFKFEGFGVIQNTYKYILLPVLFIKIYSYTYTFTCPFCTICSYKAILQYFIGNITI